MFAYQHQHQQLSTAKSSLRIHATVDFKAHIPHEIRKQEIISLSNLLIRFETQSQSD